MGVVILKGLGKEGEDTDWEEAHYWLDPLK